MPMNQCLQGGDRLSFAQRVWCEDLKGAAKLGATPVIWHFSFIMFFEPGGKPQMTCLVANIRGLRCCAVGIANFRFQGRIPKTSFWARPISSAWSLEVDPNALGDTLTVENIARTRPVPAVCS